MMGMSPQDQAGRIRNVLPQLGPLAVLSAPVRLGARLADTDRFRPEMSDKRPGDGEDVGILFHRRRLRGS